MIFKIKKDKEPKDTLCEAEGIAATYSSSEANKPHIYNLSSTEMWTVRDINQNFSAHKMNVSTDFSLNLENYHGFSGEVRFSLKSGDQILHRFKGIFRKGDSIFYSKNGIEKRCKTIVHEFDNIIKVYFDDESQLSINVMTDLSTVHGTINQSYGATYVGELSYSKMQGLGRLSYPDGEVCEGRFIDDQLSGVGNITRPPNTVINGFFENGNLNGWGKVSGSDGYYEEGIFENGYFTELGLIRTPIGTKYIGQLTNAQPHGLGQFTHIDGRIFVGYFQDGFGQIGRFIMPSGDVILGSFAEDGFTEQSETDFDCNYTDIELDLLIKSEANTVFYWGIFLQSNIITFYSGDIKSKFPNQEKRFLNFADAKIYFDNFISKKVKSGFKSQSNIKYQHSG